MNKKTLCNCLALAAFTILPTGPAHQAWGAELWREWNVVSSQHVDLSTGYDPLIDRWSMSVDIGDDGQAGSADERLAPDRTILLLGPAAKRTFTSDPPASFAFLGSAGDSYYRLLTNSEVGLPHLGFNAYHVDFDVFQGGSRGEIFVELTGLTGPGDFFLYLSGPTMLIDSTHEGPPFGEKRELVGGHSHQNWVFKEPGIYLLELTPHGFLAGSGTKTTGDPTTFFFLVDPTPAEWWLLDTFGQEVKETSSDLLADASGDGRSNLLAYALGFNPQAPAEPFLPVTEFIESGGETHLSMIVRRPSDEPGRADRSDLTYLVQVSDDLMTWNTLEENDHALWNEIDPDEDGIPRFRVVDSEPVNAADRRFMRLIVEYQSRQE